MDQLHQKNLNRANQVWKNIWKTKNDIVQHGRRPKTVKGVDSTSIYDRK